MKRSYKYGTYGSFEHLLVLLFQAFARIGFESQDLLSLCDGCMHRLDLNSYYHLRKNCWEWSQNRTPSKRSNPRCDIMQDNEPNPQQSELFWPFPRTHLGIFLYLQEMLTARANLRLSNRLQ